MILLSQIPPYSVLKSHPKILWDLEGGKKKTLIILSFHFQTFGYMCICIMLIVLSVHSAALCRAAGILQALCWIPET